MAASKISSKYRKYRQHISEINKMWQWHNKMKISASNSMAWLASGNGWWQAAKKPGEKYQ